jgi:phosphatidylserine/phosphatidylglycerophosphate/cardiolipin synthase-like enzyme
LARPINSGHVFSVHSKTFVIDALSNDLLVCSGSANFSKSSLIANDENMLLTRGETRVADIYLTEIDRIFRYFYERDVINRVGRTGCSPAGLHLDKTSAQIDSIFRPGSSELNRLNTFFPDAAASGSWSANAAQDPDPFADETERAAKARPNRNERARTRRATNNGPAPKRSEKKLRRRNRLAISGRRRRLLQRAPEKSARKTVVKKRAAATKAGKRLTKSRQQRNLPPRRRARRVSQRPRVSPHQRLEKVMRALATNSVQRRVRRQLAILS